MTINLPEPDCPIGYPESQLRELFGDQFEAFLTWLYG